MRLQAAVHQVHNRSHRSQRVLGSLVQPQFLHHGRDHLPFANVELLRALELVWVAVLSKGGQAKSDIEMVLYGGE